MNQSLIDRLNYLLTFGNRYHYNDNTLEIVKKNFNFAFSNFEGLVHKDSNIYELPRFLVRDWDIDKFILKFKSFSEIIE